MKNFYESSTINYKVSVSKVHPVPDCYNIIIVSQYLGAKNPDNVNPMLSLCITKLALGNLIRELTAVYENG